MEARRDSKYVPLDARASWAKGLLLVAGLVDIVAVLTGFALYRLLEKGPSGTVTLHQFQAAEDRYDLVALFQIGVYLVAAVFFIRWFHRAYANLPAVGVDRLDHSTGWAIAAWFIPIVSLFWPKRIADEIWRGSEPSLEPDQAADWRRGKVPAFYGLWWLTFIASGILVGIGSRMWDGGQTFSDLELAALVQIIGDALGVVSGVLAYVVVDRTSDRQEARAAKFALWRPALDRT